jgi:formate C-acetyltransferase
MFSERIQKLREASLDAVNRLSAERALLVTQFYTEHPAGSPSVPVHRARAFEYLLRHKQLCINEGELIVGERGPAPKATPTYPEISLHSLADLEMLDTREKVSFRVDQETFQAYRDTIIPFWQGRTNRDRIFGRMTPEWIAAYEAGVFTEFQEQRAPGHTVLGKKIYEKGLLDLVEEINEQQSARVQELEAMKIAAHAMIMYAERNADLLREMAVQTQDPRRKSELLQMEQVCRKVPAHAPETLHEALQYYWFVHLGVITELNPWDSFNPGRLDQHLLPFYERDLAEGRLTEASARELLQAFWIKFNNHPSPPKMGVTAQESSTYTDFCLVNLGGVKEDGSDAVNKMSFLLLDVIEEMRLLQPSSMIQVSRQNPDSFVDRAIQIVKTGFGQPSIFNTDAIVLELLNQGKEIVDARNGGASGCVETGAFGTEAYWLTGYFNLVKVLELALHNGMDPRTGKQVGVRIDTPGRHVPESTTGTAAEKPVERTSGGQLESIEGVTMEFATFEVLQEAFRIQLNYLIDIKIAGNNVIEQLFAEHLPVPFLSLFIDDCIQNGKDYNAGGARYNTSYIQGVGLGSVTDCMAALKTHVYDRKTISLDSLLKVLSADFDGHEEIRAALVYKTPKYGNDDDAADVHATWVFEQFHAAVDGKPNQRGGVTRINMLPTTSHVYFGSVVGATPDGRHAGEPLSEGISPFQGMDTHGPTAVLKSAAKIDHLKTGGTLLNQKFTPAFFRDAQSIRKITQLVRGYFSMMGHHIQFNVVSADTLRDAQQHPEKYRDLIVRVAGYSDYFNDLGEALQNEIIRRTEQEL